MAKSGYPVIEPVGVNVATEPLALFGGTFDPVHYAHLRCADETGEKLGLETIYLLPAGCPPHRAKPQASNKQRLEMLQLALAEFPRLRIDPRELYREGPSYMVDTLQELRLEFPLRPLLMIVGQDAANYLQTWHRWQTLFDLAHIVILTRPGEAAKYQPQLARQMEQRRQTDMQAMISTAAGGVWDLEVTAIDISATMIKRMVHLGRSPRAMLPLPVLDYINDQGLYLSQ